MLVDLLQRQGGGGVPQESRPPLFQQSLFGQFEGAQVVRHVYDQNDAEIGLFSGKVAVNYAP